MSVQTNEPQSNSVLEGIKQGTTLGVTGMADSTPTINEDTANLTPTIQINEDLPPEQEVALGGKLFKLFSTPRKPPLDPPASTIDESGSSLLVKDGVADEKAAINFEPYDQIITNLDIDFNSINTLDDFAAVIDTVIKRTPDPGTETNQEVFMLAKDLDMRPSLLFGKGFKDAKEVYAARSFLANSHNQLIKLADELIKNPTDGELAIKFRKHLTLHGLFVTNFKQGRADVGRALRAFQLPTMADAPSQANAIEEMLAEFGGQDSIVDIAVKTKTLFDKNGMPATNNYVGENFFKRSSKAWSEAYRGGLLFSPKTQLRNIIGNAFYLSYSVPEYILAGIYGNIESAVINGGGKLLRGNHWGGYNNGMTWEMGVARLYGMVHGFGDALYMGYKGFSGSVSDNITKYEGATNDYITAKNLNLENSIFASTVDFMGKIYRLPYQGLTAGDEFFKEMARAMEMHTLVMENATMLSRNTGKPYKEAFEEVLTDVMSNPQKYKTSIDDAARYYTFQDQMPKMLEQASKAIQSTPYVGTILLPFAKTPVNVTRRFLDMSTGSLPKGLVSGEFFTNAKVRNKTLARITLMSLFAMKIADVYQSGHITGGYPLNANGMIDMKQKAALDAIGWKPYSLVFRGEGFPEDMPLFKDGNQLEPNGNLTYVSYNGLEPVGALLGVTAHTMELMHRSPNPRVRENIAVAFTLAMQKYIAEMPMVQGAADILGVLREGKLDNVGADIILNMIAAPIAPLAPIKAAGGIFQGENVDDEYLIYKRNTDADFERDMRMFIDTTGDGKGDTPNLNYGNQVNTTFYNPFIEEFNKLLFQMPYDEGLTLGETIWGKTSTGKDLPLALDIFAEPIRMDGSRGLINEISNKFISPFNIVDAEKKGKHVYENIRLGSPITNPQPIKFGVKLKPEEYYDWITISKKTKWREFGNRTFEEHIIYTMNSNEYMFELNDNEKYQKIQSINTKALQLGFDLMMMNPKYNRLSQLIDMQKEMIEMGLLPDTGVNIIE